MQNKKLIQIFMPVYDQKGQLFPEEYHLSLKKGLTKKFGGLTAYTHAPATGFWKENSSKTVKDEIVIYEVVCDNFDQDFWKTYKQKLEKQLDQNELMIRVSDVATV